jgi:NAD(P)-dependent dehydrogenase (short-subunit alcohol dehydrogenase family)
MRLKDKVALMIGCSPNIGRSMARVFAKEGASVVVNDIKEEEGKETVSLIEKSGGRAVFIPTDISTSEGLEEVVSFAVDTYGRLDVFVSLANAGNSRSVAEFDRSAAELCYAVNVLALIEGTRYCLPHMKAADGGSVIAISSIQGVRGTGWNPGYAAAKSGLIGAARCMAVELWQHGIRVNVIYPSGVPRSPSWEVIDRLGEEYLPEFEEAMGNEMRSIPFPSIDSMALGHAALFLASDESEYITGITLPVDAGTNIAHYGVRPRSSQYETPHQRREYQRAMREKLKNWISEKENKRS